MPIWAAFTVAIVGGMVAGEVVVRLERWLGQRD